MGKNKAAGSKDNKHANQKSSQQTGKSDRMIIKKVPQKKSGKRADDGESKKINYVLNPKKIQEQKTEVKEAARREKEKSYQTQKRKRNSAYLRTTSKGQPALNARMKVLYGQIQKSFASGK